MIRFLGNLGHVVLSALESAGYAVLLFLRSTMWFHWIGARWHMIVQQMYVTGWQSLAVTLMFSGVAGMIIALQTGLEIRKFGLEARIGSIVALSMLREMGPLMAAIILTGRVGSSMAAELGTMAVSEEVDALETLAIDPVRFLVMPRVVAMALITPMLTILASFVGLVGGAFVAWAQVGVNFDVYVNSAREAVFFRDLYWGIGKSLVFGVCIAVIACANGIRAYGGALGVGRASRNTVVTALVLVIFVNYIISSFFLAFDDTPPM